MDVEVGAQKLLALIVIGVAIVIAVGIMYTNYNNSQTQLKNAGVSNGILANYTTNAGNIANTGGSNANYAYYILFAALIIAVVVGALKWASSRQ